MDGHGRRRHGEQFTQDALILRPDQIHVGAGAPQGHLVVRVVFRHHGGDGPTGSSSSQTPDEVLGAIPGLANNMNADLGFAFADGSGQLSDASGDDRLDGRVRVDALEHFPRGRIGDLVVEEHHSRSAGWCLRLRSGLGCGDGHAAGITSGVPSPRAGAIHVFKLIVAFASGRE